MGFLAGGTRRRGYRGNVGQLTAEGALLQCATVPFFPMTSAASSFPRAKQAGSIRAKLGLISVTMAAAIAQACIVAPPPDFQDPISERPNVNAELVVPPLGQILVAERNGPSIPFTIPYSGRDAGEEVIVQFWLNWGLEDELYISQVSMDPTGEDTERTFQGTWQAKSNLPPGCQQLTVLLSHESNVPNDSPFRPVDPNLVGRVTWWVNIDVPENAQQNLVNCPTFGP